MSIHNSNQGQRNFERIPRKVNVRINLFNDQESKATVTKNITERGVCICSDELYETGAVLKLQIDLEGWQVYLRTVLSRTDNGTDIHPLSATGEVIWSHEQSDGKGYEVGIQFTEIDEQTFKAFQQYLHIIRETVR